MDARARPHALPPRHAELGAEAYPGPANPDPVRGAPLPQGSCRELRSPLPVPPVRRPRWGPDRGGRGAGSDDVDWEPLHAAAETRGGDPALMSVLTRNARAKSL